MADGKPGRPRSAATRNEKRLLRFEVNEATDRRIRAAHRGSGEALGTFLRNTLCDALGIPREEPGKTGPKPKG